MAEDRLQEQLSSLRACQPGLDAKSLAATVRSGARARRRQRGAVAVAAGLLGMAGLGSLWQTGEAPDRVLLDASMADQIAVELVGEAGAGNAQVLVGGSGYSALTVTSADADSSETTMADGLLADGDQLKVTVTSPKWGGCLVRTALIEVVDGRVRIEASFYSIAGHSVDFYVSREQLEVSVLAFGCLPSSGLPSVRLIPLAGLQPDSAAE